MVTPEGAPPEEKRSFVSEGTIKEKNAIPTQKIIRIGDKEVPILPPEIAPTLIYGKLSAIFDELKALNSLFSKAAGETKTFAQPAIQPTVQHQSTPVPVTKTESTEQSPRVKEIIAAFVEVSDLLNIDTETSTMFVQIKPRQFLGSDNFSKIASIVRAIGGRYVSAGKNSHFEVPKAPQKQQ